MTGTRNRPRVVALRCRACTTELPAASNDVAFRCPQCGRAWEIEGDGLREQPSFYVTAPGGTSGSLLYLPYWSFAISVSAEPLGPMAEAALTARDRAARIQRAFVSAYAIYRPTYVGEWGLVYTRLQPKWEVRRGHGPDAPGAAIFSTEAGTLARHYVLAEIDRASDLGSLDVSLQVGDPELWAIPCSDLGSSVRCPWTRSELPVAALDDLSEIRRASERKEA